MKQIEAEYKEPTAAELKKAIADGKMGQLVSPEQIEAVAVVGKWMIRKNQIPELLMAMAIQNISSAQEAIAFAGEMLDADDLDGFEKANAVNAWVAATKTCGELIAKAGDMANAFGIAGKKPVEPSAPKNKAPDMMVALQVNTTVGACPEKPVG